MNLDRRPADKTEEGADMECARDCLISIKGLASEKPRSTGRFDSSPSGNRSDALYVSNYLANCTGRAVPRVARCKRSESETARLQGTVRVRPALRIKTHEL